MSILSCFIMNCVHWCGSHIFLHVYLCLIELLLLTSIAYFWCFTWQFSEWLTFYIDRYCLSISCFVFGFCEVLVVDVSFVCRWMNNSLRIFVALTYQSNEWRRWKTGCSSWQCREEQWWSSGKKAGSTCSSVSLIQFCSFLCNHVMFSSGSGVAVKVFKQKSLSVGVWKYWDLLNHEFQWQSSRPSVLCLHDPGSVSTETHVKQMSC